MLATLGKPPARFADFAVEAKYDGQRGMAVIDDDTVTLLSRNGAEITRTFPEITAALLAAATTDFGAAFRGAPFAGAFSPAPTARSLRSVMSSPFCSF
jgi:ATP-dependent DNA ligase